MGFTQVMTALAGGILTFLSPCILPLIPLYLGYLGATMDVPGKNTRRVIPFIIGFSLVFILMGLTATAIGHFLVTQQILLKQISGVLLIILGFMMSGLLPGSSLLGREYKLDYVPRRPSWPSGLLFGVAFALGWTPCTGPILASILLYAGSGNTMSWGAILLAVYSLGIGIPLLIAAYFADRFLLPLLAKRQLMRRLQIGGGLLMALLGGFILSGNL